MKLARQKLMNSFPAKHRIFRVSVFSLLNTRGRCYASKTQIRKTQKRAMSYVSICI